MRIVTCVSSTEPSSIWRRRVSALANNDESDSSIVRSHTLRGNFRGGKMRRSPSSCKAWPVTKDPDLNQKVGPISPPKNSRGWLRDGRVVRWDRTINFNAQKCQKRVVSEYKWLDSNLLCLTVWADCKTGCDSNQLWLVTNYVTTEPRGLDPRWTQSALIDYVTLRSRSAEEKAIVKKIIKVQFLHLPKLHTYPISVRPP